LTGGEPTIRRDLEILVEKLASLSALNSLAMTTNGLLLSRQAVVLRRAGLKSLNISLDTLRPQRFTKITLHDRFEDVMKGIDAALDAGFSPLKLNVVVMAGINEDEMLDFVEFARDRPLNVRFIEFMPFPGNAWGTERYVPWLTMKNIVESKYALLAKPVITPGAVSRDFFVEDFVGSVSFIAPLTAEFCDSCNRLRLTADGAIKSCLLFPAELPLRDALRNGASDADIASLIVSALTHKEFVHSPEYSLLKMDNRCMTAIGG
jgi:cyclic pyranopterin phosphate synthase